MREAATDGGADRLFESMSHPSRRRILFFLEERRDDAAAPVDALFDDGRDDAFARLYHVHLPKLNDAGYVDWDSEAGTVSRGPAFEAVEPLLDLFREHREELPDGIVPPRFE